MFIYSKDLPWLNRILQYLIRRRNGCTFDDLLEAVGDTYDSTRDDMRIMLYELIEMQFIDMFPKRKSLLDKSFEDPTDIPEVVYPVKPEHLRNCYITQMGIDLAKFIQTFYDSMKNDGIEMDNAVVFKEDIEYVKRELTRRTGIPID